jgi:4-hydroxy-tetrahydrodipicolinate synthase
MSNNPQRFKGIYTPNLVPLDAAGAIDEAELRRYTEWLIAKGDHGL